MLNKDFLRLILQEKKRLLKLKDKKSISVPHYDELSVKNLWPRFKLDAEFMKLMPDKLPKGKQVDRKYFWTCLNTLYPAYAEDLIKNANANRNRGGMAETAQDEILISDSWWAKLNEMPYIKK